MRTKYTPGPWVACVTNGQRGLFPHVHVGTDYICGREHDEEITGDCHTCRARAGRMTINEAGAQKNGSGLSEFDANARLIAVSPEMFELLVESQGSIGGDWRDRRDALLVKVLA